MSSAECTEAPDRRLCRLGGGESLSCVSGALLPSSGRGEPGSGGSLGVRTRLWTCVTPQLAELQIAGSCCYSTSPHVKIFELLTLTFLEDKPGSAYLQIG